VQALLLEWWFQSALEAVISADLLSKFVVGRAWLRAGNDVSDVRIGAWFTVGAVDFVRFTLLSLRSLLALLLLSLLLLSTLVHVRIHSGAPLA
jgi:hypothetical protein